MVFEKKKYIGLEEASKIIGIHKNTLYQWIRKDLENKNYKKVYEEMNLKDSQIEKILFLHKIPISRLFGVDKNIFYNWVTKNWKNKNHEEFKKIYEAMNLEGAEIEQIFHSYPHTYNILCPPYIRLGNRYRFKREDIEKFIKDTMKS